MSKNDVSTFEPNCRRCERLAAFLSEVSEKHPDYHCRPVAPFGVTEPDLLIVGLAPGMHGANATGRPFTGDHAGILLYETLYKFGFSNQAKAESRDDGLELIGCRITNAVKCLPPQNKPTTSEIKICNDFLAAELRQQPADSIVLALGKIAHDAVVRAMGEKLSGYGFAHGAQHDFTGFRLFDSYHCSRYNTQTRRLTPAMFDALFSEIRTALS